MADNAPRPPQRAWRNDLPGPAKPGKAQRAWKAGGQDAAQARQPWSRRSKLFLAGGLFAVLVGVFTIVVLWLIPAKPIRLVLVTAGYETNLSIPHNVAGRQTAAKLAALFKDSKLVEVKACELTSDLAALDEALARCGSQTVVVLVAAHGGADDEGAYLVPQDAELHDRDRSRVRLTTLLDRLKTKLPEGTKKLLILDATQVTA
jgi:hypothetical protein